MHEPISVLHFVQRAAAVIPALLVATLITACTGGSGVSGNEQGSEPVNSTEAVEYQKAVVRCYKTGGTRIVKIMGQLRCY